VAVITSWCGTRPSRRLALVAQRQALVHAEAVLLVDDGQAEIVELDAFLHQCACVPTTTCAAPDATSPMRFARALPVTLPASQRRGCRAAPASRAGWPGAARPAVRSAPSARPGGRRDRQQAPPSRRPRSCRCRRRPAPGAASARGLRQVVAHLREHPLLRAVSANGSASRRPPTCVPAQQRGAAACAAGDALPTQAQVMRQQFLQRQSPLRRMRARLQRGHVGIARRPMQGQQRLAQAMAGQLAQPVARQQFQRVLVGQTRPAPARSACAALAGPMPSTAGYTGSSASPSAALAGIAQHAIARMHDLQARAGPARRAVGAHARAGANCATCWARKWKNRSTSVPRESSPIATRSIGRKRNRARPPSTAPSTCAATPGCRSRIGVSAVRSS
jgi:hypothetical protein